MEISQIALARLYLFSAVLGIFAGMLYDVLYTARILFASSDSATTTERKLSAPLPLLPKRKQRKRSFFLGKILLFFTDLLFCLTIGVALILLIYQMNNGKMRFPILICMMVGFGLYRLTLHRPLIRIVDIILFGLQNAVRYLCFFIFLPIRIILNWIRKISTRVYLFYRQKHHFAARKRFTKNEYLRMSEEACGMLEIRNEKKMDKKGGNDVVRRNRKKTAV